jgi:hypothetical protein
MLLTLEDKRTCTGGLFALATCALILSQQAAHAQLPQAKITSLSRAGIRAGESVEVTFRGTDLEGASQIWFDDPGIRAIHVKDLTFRIVCGPEVPLGHHDVRVVGTFGVSNPRTFVVGDRPEQMEVEPNNTPDRATPVLVGTVVWGEISAATEVDCFALEGKKGQRVILDLQAERIDSRLDATLRLLGPSGTELAESRDVFGADPFLDVVLPADGRYVIKLHDAVYAGSPDHVYRLLVHDGPHLDAALPLAAVQGSSATFVLMGRGLGAEAVMDGSLGVDGRPLERLTASIPVPSPRDWDPGHSQRFTPCAAATGDPSFDYRFIRLSPRGAAPLCSNMLSLAATAGPARVEREPNNEEAQAQTVVPPCDISGIFAAPGDLDLYRFQGHKGDVWRIEVVAERQGSMADPVMLIQKVGAKGQPSRDLAGGDDLPDAGAGARFNTQSVDAEARFPVPEDGLYQVQLSDLYSSQRGDPRLFYRLLIRPEHPDFRLVVVPGSATGTDAVTVRAGGRTSAYVVAIRTDGFSGPIRVEALSLPEGVRCRPVVIGPGQVLTPIVFESDPSAKNGVGTVTLVGRARFGDRKDELSYVSGATVLGQDVEHTAVAGGMTWPPNASVPTVAPARFFHGFVIAVRGEPAPLTLTASPETWVVAQGRQIDLDLSVTRRAGFIEAVTVTGADLPSNMTGASVTIPKEAKTAALPVFIPKSVPPGTYSFVVRGSGPYPFNKDPKAKEKPNITLSEPSNPITLTVRPAPLSFTVDNKGGTLKQAQRLEIEASITRQNGFAGPVILQLNAPASLKLAGNPVTLASDQAKAKLVLRAAKDSPTGAAANVTIRATGIVRSESVQVDEPIALTISK